MTEAVDVRTRILAAARGVMREVGPDAVRMDEVAGRAGVARPNLYRYFASKSELVRELLLSEVRQIHEQRHAALAGVTDPWARIVESLVLGAAQARGADAVIAVAGERLDGVDRLVAEDSELMELEGEYWIPLLAAGRTAGVVRADLSDDRAIRWFMTCQLIAATQPALVGDDLRSWVLQFVVPPIGTEGRR